MTTTCHVIVISQPYEDPETEAAAWSSDMVGPCYVPWGTMKDGRWSLCPGCTQHFSFLHFSLLSKFWDTSTLWFTQDFDLEIDFITHLFKFLHTKPRTCHSLFFFSHLLPFILSTDPKMNVWSPELLTSSLILPHVPGMKCLILIFSVHICIQITRLLFVFHIFVPWVLKSSECPAISEFRVWAAGLQSLLGFWRPK